MTMVTNFTLALVANLNRSFMAVLCVSGLVSAMNIQLMLHGPQPGKDLSLLSIMLLLLWYMAVQIRCPGQVKAGHGPGASHKKNAKGVPVVNR